jgi:drug/metabolite transporter (DMT)-like permease
LTQQSTARGYSAALGASALLSTTAVFIRFLTNNYQMPPLLLAFWRAFFVVVTLLLFFGWRRFKWQTDRLHLPYLALYGLVLALFNSFWTLSVALNGAAVATVLAYSSAAFTAVLGWWFLHEKLTWAKGTAVMLALTGCVLVADALNADAWAVNPLGIFTGLLTGLGYAVYSLMGRAAANRGVNPWISLLYAFGFATLVLAGFNLIPGSILPGTAVSPQAFFWLGRTWLGWAILVLLAAGPTVAGFGLYNVSLSLLPSSVANLILTTEPLFTAVLAFALLNERLTALQIGGGLFILGGVLLLRVSK